MPAKSKQVSIQPSPPVLAWLLGLPKGDRNRAINSALEAHLAIGAPVSSFAAFMEWVEAEPLVWQAVGHNGRDALRAVIVAWNVYRSGGLPE